MIGRPGCGTVPDERPAHRAEHARDRRRRRPWRRSATGRTRRTSSELAELWNVEALQIPHWAPPTHAMQIFRYAEEGSIRFLWVIGTNPAVSLPDLAPRSARSSQQERSVRRRQRRLPQRDRRTRGRRPAHCPVGREDGCFHERTTAPFISRRRPWIRLARRAPISTSSSSTRAASGFAIATANH